MLAISNARNSPTAMFKITEKNAKKIVFFVTVQSLPSVNALAKFENPVHSGAENKLYFVNPRHTIAMTGIKTNVKNKIITIDPGHGGSDAGAVGPNGYTEKEGAFAISQKVASILNQSGAKVVMTRDSDVDVYGPNASARNELQARVDVGNNANSDIFVSIHCNAFVNPAANGTQTFYYGSSYQGQRLAQSIQEKMIEANGLRDRGISTCNFYVVKHSYMPAVLIETAFITNYDEEALLSDDEWQTTMAKAIAEGINEYFSI